MTWDEKIEEKKNDLSWLEDPTETIMIFGMPKQGKTYAYCSYIEDTLNKGNKVYIISTDKGFVRTAKAYFGKDIKEKFKDQVIYQEVTNIDETRKYYLKIKDKLNKNDLLIIDLLSDFWEWAQIDFLEKISKGNLQDYIINASTDPRKFGMFEGSKWNYIKALHKFVEDVVSRKPCNFIAVCTEKDTAGETAIGGIKAEKKLKDTGFQNLGYRAGGQKDMPYKFETIIRISYNSGKYFYQVIGDRGRNPNYQQVDFGKNLKNKIDEWRKNG